MTRVELMPPERKAPSGASDTRWSPIAERRSASSSSTASPGSAQRGLPLPRHVASRLWNGTNAGRLSLAATSARRPGSQLGRAIAGWPRARAHSPNAGSAPERLRARARFCTAPPLPRRPGWRRRRRAPSRTRQHSGFSPNRSRARCRVRVAVSQAPKANMPRTRRRVSSTPRRAIASTQHFGVRMPAPGDRAAPLQLARAGSRSCRSRR